MTQTQPFTPSKYLHSFASFDTTGKHRNLLFRRWSDNPTAMVIGLNPSTANECQDDPTIRSIRRILANNGYGALYMLNLFTFITPYPEELEGPASSNYDKKYCLRLWKQNHVTGRALIFGWGNFETHGRDKLAIKTYGDIALCFGRNANGSPKHPLYLKSTTTLEKFNHKQ